MVSPGTVWACSGGKIDGRSDICSLGPVPLAAAALGEPLDMRPVADLRDRGAARGAGPQPGAGGGAGGPGGHAAARSGSSGRKRCAELIRTSEQRGGRRSGPFAGHVAPVVARRSRVRAAWGAIVGALAVIVGGRWRPRLLVLAGPRRARSRDGTTRNRRRQRRPADRHQRALNSGAADGHAAREQSTASTTATQTRTSTSAEGGTGATGTQQQETAAGTTSSSAVVRRRPIAGRRAGRTRRRQRQAAINPPPQLRMERLGRRATTGSRNRTQENASTTVAPTVTSQRRRAASSQQQASNATPAVTDLQSSATMGRCCGARSSATERLATRTRRRRRRHAERRCRARRTPQHQNANVATD